MMVAIADAITPQLSSQYYVEVESRTYQSDESDEELLIGIPDAIIFAGKAGAALTESPMTETTSITTQLRPEKFRKVLKGQHTPSSTGDHSRQEWPLTQWQ
nr:DUF4058 family protein [Leptolyngbya sp. FACHB-541]